MNAPQNAAGFPCLLDEGGRSLPGVLIAISVGTILIGPFLNHVSSRMLGLSAVDQAAREQYASDSGVEFGVWKLLNDPAFRNNVDANLGSPVAVSPPITVNGEITTIDVTALPLGEWTEVASTPAAVGAGGALAIDGNLIYALRGNGTNDFWRYSIPADSWIALADAPRSVDGRGSLVHADGDIYALLDASFCFLWWCWEPLWRYDGTGWGSTSFHPGSGFGGAGETGPGAALAADGNDHVYVLRGNGSTEYWRYMPNPDSWSTRANAPAVVSEGGSLAYATSTTFYALRGGVSNKFWRYQGNSWSGGPANTPAGVGAGGALDYDGGSYMYALRGNGTSDFWRYSISGDFWQDLAEPPQPVGAGGDLIYSGGSDFYALRGSNSQTFWRFEITPPRYDINASAGNVQILARVEISGSIVTVIFWDIQ